MAIVDEAVEIVEEGQLIGVDGALPVGVREIAGVAMRVGVVEVVAGNVSARPQSLQSKGGIADVSCTLTCIVPWRS